MKQIYIMGFGNEMEKSEAEITSNALKNIRVQYETTTVKNQGDPNAENHTDDKRSYKLLNIFKNWQVKDFEKEDNILRSRSKKNDKGYLKKRARLNLITAREYPYKLNNEFTRLEELVGKVEGISWARRSEQDYFFLCESGEFRQKYIKLENQTYFGRRGDNEDETKHRENWLLFQNDKKVSKQHFCVEIDKASRDVFVKDLNSSSGTWLALMHHVEEEIVPGVVYKSSLLDTFTFELGIRCDSLEEILGYFGRYDAIDYFLGLDMDDFQEILAADMKNIHLDLEANMVSSNPILL